MSYGLEVRDAEGIPQIVIDRRFLKPIFIWQTTFTYSPSGNMFQQATINLPGLDLSDNSWFLHVDHVDMTFNAGHPFNIVSHSLGQVIIEYSTYAQPEGPITLNGWQDTLRLIFWKL